MGSFSTIKLSNLTNDSFRTLYVRIHLEIAHLPDCKRKAAFEQAWADFEKAMDDSTKLRRSLKDYDADCDKAWLMLMAQLRASSIHFDSARANAAIIINGIIEPIGNLTDLPYEIEYALIRKALNQIAEIDPAILQAALVDDIVAHLRKTYETFLSAQLDENIVRSNYQTGAVRTARLALIEAWRKYAPVVEILSDDDEVASNAIERINQCIEDACGAR